MERERRDLVRLDRIEPRATPLAATAGREADEATLVLGHAAYFAELLDEWAPEDAPNERLFRLGAAMGDALGAAGSVEALARYFEYWLLRLEGVYPSLGVCPLKRGGVPDFHRASIGPGLPLPVSGRGLGGEVNSSLNQYFHLLCSA